MLRSHLRMIQLAGSGDSKKLSWLSLSSAMGSVGPINVVPVDTWIDQQV